MKKILKKAFKSIALALILFLVNLVNSPAVYATAVSDSYTDTTKINTSASSDYSTTGGQLSISPNFSAGDGADGAITVSANKNINTESISDIEDSSANANEGTATGTRIVEGKYGNARDFKGSAELISMGNVLDQTGANPLSVEAWVKTNAGGAVVYTIVSKLSISATAGFQLGFNVVTAAAGDAGKVGFFMGDGTTYFRRQTTSTYNDGNWHHVAATYDGSKTRAGALIYIDGNLATVTDHDSASYSGSATNAINFQVGARNGANQVFIGQIDDVRFYDYVRSSSQVVEDRDNGTITGNPAVGFWKFDEDSVPDGANYSVSAIGTNTVTLGTNPVAYWKMDEAADNSCSGGQDACDSSGNNYHGTATGTSIKTGKYANTRAFNGAGDVISIPAASMPTGNQITLEFWAYGYTNQPVANSVFFAQDASAIRTANIHLPWSDGIVYWDSGGSGGNYDRISKAATAADYEGRWTHWAFIKNATTGSMKIYLDGVLWHSGTGLTRTLTTTTGANIGNTNYPGMVDEVRIYNYERSAVQIIEDMFPATSGLAAGDDVLLINEEGDATNFDNVGNQEILTVQSVTNNTVTFTANVTKTYGVGGNSDLTGQKIIIQRVPNYTDITIASGATLTAGSWDGTKGGIVALKASGTVTVAGTIAMNGTAGGNGGATAGAAGVGGEYGAAGGNVSGNGNNGFGFGKGLAGILCTNGGDVASGASGASYGTQGTAGQSTFGGCEANVPAPGATYGAQELTDLLRGSGGGGGGGDTDTSLEKGGGGGGGGGIVYIIGQTVNVTGTISSNGGNGGNHVNANDGEAGAGGAGSGGSIKLAVNGLTNTGTISATGGTGGTAAEYGTAGGNGGAGRIAIYYASSQSGTTSPTAYTSQDMTDWGGSGYNTSSTIVSTNLLSGISVDTVDEFVYNLSTKPAGTSATIQFSQNGTTWYNSSGVQDGTNDLTTGANNTILIHDLGWSGGNFYYKIAFGSDGTSTPTLADVTVNYTTAGYEESSNNATDTYSDTSKINSSLSTSELVSGGQLTIFPTYPNTLWWPLNEASGTSLADSSGNNYTGTALSRSVGWWKLDEASGSGVADYWNNANGTATGTTVIGGQYSNARNFNGTSDWVNLGANKVGPVVNGASQVTVSAWLKPSAFPAASGRKRAFNISVASVPSLASGLVIYLYNDAGTIKAESGGRSVSGDAYQFGRTNYTGALNEWHHVAGVIDFATDTITVYYDGTPGTPTSVNFGNTVYTNGNPGVGYEDTIGTTRNNGGNVDYFSGGIDDVRIYKNSRTQAEIQADMNNAAGPAVVAGQYSNARSFGTTDYIVSSTSHNFTTEDFSVMMWVNPTSLANNPVLFTNGQYDTDGYYVQLTAAGAVVFRTDQAAAHQDSYAPNGTITTGSWQHLAFIRSGSSVTIYKNGVDVTSTHGTHINPASTTQPFTVGTYGPSPTGWFYTGSVDDVRVYSSARTTDQINYDKNYTPYDTAATIYSTNLLTGLSGIVSIDSFVYNLSSKPAGTTATIQFSQDGQNWYNSSGAAGGTDTLSTGVDNTISLASLAWSGPYFYYKIAYTGDRAGTPVMDDITLNYTTLTSTVGSTWAACKPLPGGNFTVSDNCYFPNTQLANPDSNIDGVDNGDLTVQTYKTLTIKGDQQVVRNPGKGITLQNGASMVINDLPLGAVGGNVRDYSGTGNDGGAVGSTIVAGKYNKARFFNGTTEWINLDFGTIGASLNTASAITFEAWINPSSLPSSGIRSRIISANLAAEVGAGSGLVLALYNDAGTVKVEAGGRSVNTDSYQTARETWGGGTGSWHHVAGVINYPTDTITIYIDGVAGTPQSVTFGNAAFTQVTSAVGYEDAIGAYRNNSLTNDYWSGLIDDVRVYNYGLTTEQIQDDMNYGSVNKAAPIAWYRFEDGGQIKQTNLWVQDIDGDGWSQNPETQQRARTNSPGTGWVRRNTTVGSEFGDGRDGTITFATNTNLNTTNHDGRSCADGGDAVNYSVTALGSTSLPNGSSVTTATVSTSISSGCLLAGDTVLLTNLQGTSSASTNTGNYEMLKVFSYSGTGVTFSSAKKNYYGDGATDDTNLGTGASNQKVVLQRVPQYNNVTVNEGVTVTANAWDGTKGGVVAFMVKGTATITGTVSASGLGYRGGTAGGEVGGNGESFDGRNGTGGTIPGNAGTFGGGRGSGATAVSPAGNRGGGGGGGDTSAACCSAGGTSGGGGGGYGGGGGGGGGAGGWQGFPGGAGGNGGAADVRGGGGGAGGSQVSGTAGGNAGASAADSGYNGWCDWGRGGAVAAADASTGQGGGGGCANDFGPGGGGGGGIYGVANLSKLFYGSGGGGTGGISAAGKTGGTGGGIVLIRASALTIAGSVTSSGAAGQEVTQASGGGGNGSGGSILLKAATATLGANLVSAPLSNGGGASFQGGGRGGGGVGRIAVSANSVTGTSSPNYNANAAP